MVPKFDRQMPELCVIINTLMYMIYEQKGFRSTSFDREILNPQSLQTNADVSIPMGGYSKLDVIQETGFFKTEEVGYLGFSLKHELI